MTRCTPKSLVDPILAQVQQNAVSVVQLPSPVLFEKESLLSPTPSSCECLPESPQSLLVRQARAVMPLLRNTRRLERCAALSLASGAPSTLRDSSLRFLPKKRRAPLGTSQVPGTSSRSVFAPDPPGSLPPGTVPLALSTRLTRPTATRLDPQVLLCQEPPPDIIEDFCQEVKSEAKAGRSHASSVRILFQKPGPQREMSADKVPCFFRPPAWLESAAQGQGRARHLSERRGEDGGRRSEASRAPQRASQLGADAMAEAEGPWSTRKFSRGTLSLTFRLKALQG